MEWALHVVSSKAETTSLLVQPMEVDMAKEPCETAVHVHQRGTCSIVELLRGLTYRHSGTALPESDSGMPESIC